MNPKFSSTATSTIPSSINNTKQIEHSTLGWLYWRFLLPTNVAASTRSPYYGPHHPSSRVLEKIHHSLSSNKAFFQAMSRFPSNSFSGDLCGAAKTSGSDKSTWVEILEKINKNENSKFSSVVFLGMLFAIQNYVQNHLKMIGRSDRTVWKNSIKWKLVAGEGCANLTFNQLNNNRYI